MLDAIEAAPRGVRGRLVAVCVLGLLAMVGWPEMAAGAEFPAGCTGTTGDAGALAAAITQANTAGGANVVQLEQGCVYTLKAVDNSWYGPNGLPPIASEVTIEGNGATIARSEAQATPSFRLFFVGANPLRAETLGYTSPGGGVLTLRDVTLTGGLAKGGRTFGGGGGGAGMGGAIFSQGSVTIENSTLTANRAQGGATSTGSGGGGGIGTDATNSSGGGFGPGTFNGATGGAGGAGGGGGGAGFRSSENGVPASSSAPGAGGGPQTGLGGAGGTGAAGGDGSGGGGASSGGGLTGGLGGAFGTGGVTGGFLGSGGGGGGIGGGGGGSGMTGGGGGFGAGGGAAYDSQIGSATVRQAGGTGGFGGGGGGSYLLTGGVVGAPGFGGGTPVATNGGGGAGMGGAIFNMQGVLTIRNSTLTGNSAAGGTSNAAVTDPGKGMAGAVFNFSGTFTAVSSTIAANRADHYASQILNLVYDGAQTRNAVTTLVNSIVANGSGGAPADVASDKSTYITPAQPAGSTSVVDASRFDLLTTPVATVIAPGELGETTGSPLVADPKLGPLQDNGGPTKTMAPAPGSPVLDAGSSLGLTTDQRRDPRPVDLSATPNATGGDGADIGAFERQMVVLDNAAQSHRSWREATSRNHKRPLGTTFSYTLNQQASVQFLFMKRVRGRRVKGKCVAQTKRNRRKPACTRTITKGEISRAGHAGENKVPFRGRISPSKKLGPGDYTVIITATGVAAEPSSPQRLKFTIVR